MNSESSPRRGHRAAPLRLLLAGIVLATVVANAGAVGASEAQAAKAGSLDRNFAKNGRQLIDVFGRNDQANALAVQRDGKILMAGRAQLRREGGGGPPRMGIMRLGPGGNVDRGFGKRGRVSVRRFGGDATSQANGLAVQDNGRIIAAGANLGNVAIARLRPNGKLDQSFSGDGKLTTNFGATDRALDVAVQDNGRIVIVGVATSQGVGSLLMARYRRNGELDPTFADEGMLVTDFDTGTDVTGYALAIQPDGKLVVSGDVQSNWIVARFMPDGELDESFDGDGINYSAPLLIGRAEAVELQPDGKIVAGGTDTSGPGARFAVARYLADGSLDESFAEDGAQHTEINSTYTLSFGSGLALERGGKIVLAGTALTSGNRHQHFALARYRPDGSLDSRFANGGTTVTGFRGRMRKRPNGTVNDFANDVAIQRNGRILAGGYSAAIRRSDDFALAGYLGSRRR